MRCGVCESDALILCHLLGFSVNSFDRPPQHGAVVCVCHSDEMTREAANDTSGELGSVFPGSLVGESVFRTAKLEMLI